MTAVNKTNTPRAVCVARAQRLHMAAKRVSVFEAHNRTRMRGLRMGTGVVKDRDSEVAVFGERAPLLKSNISASTLGFEVLANRALHSNGRELLFERQSRLVMQILGTRVNSALMWRIREDVQTNFPVCTNAIRPYAPFNH